MRPGRLFPFLDQGFGADSGPMKNRWSKKRAAEWRRKTSPKGLGELVYASRLLGGDSALVLHGGGNTSAKLRVRGENRLYVKGSGRDMSAIEAAGFTALRLDPLRELRSRRSLDDDGMMDRLCAAKVSARAPAPSVETLLHAFLPAPYVVHSHANAILALTNQQAAKDLCGQAFGDAAAVVGYVMSGFALAKRVAAAADRNPAAAGIIVPHHGIFTFGETAEEAYGRMISLVDSAEKRLGKGRKRGFARSPLPRRLAAVSDVAPVLRGLYDDRLSPVMSFRTSDAVRRFVDGKELKRYGNAGTATPDHVIRTKSRPLIVPPPEAGAIDRFRAAAERACAGYQRMYDGYIGRNRKRLGGLEPADSLPRVILVPGLGLFGVGEDAAAAAVAADIAEANVATITAAERVGRFKPLAERHVFDVEYWPLERAKLGSAAAPRFQGKIVLVTGAAGTIGAAVAKAFRSAGAEVVLTDVDRSRVEAAARSLGGRGIACDVTRPASVRRAFDAACEAYGGVDIVVSNAGAAWQGEIGTVDEKTLRESFELNFFAHQTVARNAVRVMRAQGSGGCLLFNASKQAVNPGAGFGPYGAPKAATLFLVRQYAVDHGRDGIRSNGVNADRIRSGLLTDGMIKSRAGARGLTEADYMGGNLLGREVTADDIAQAFVSLAAAEKTTGAILTVDGGNIAAALR